MPTKVLDSPFDNRGNVSVFHFGGGDDTIIANVDPAYPLQGYTIDSGGGDDTVTGSTADDDITGGDGSDVIAGGLGNDTIRGGEADGSDASKGQQPAPTNELTGDLESVNLGVGEAFTGGDDTIFGGNGSTNNIHGDARFPVTFSANASFTGGDDTLSGGDSTADARAFNNMFGDVRAIFFTAAAGAGGESFTGGSDTLTGGEGATNLMFGDVQSISNDGTFVGGDDTLIGGSNGAINTMIGDAASGGNIGSVTGGNDTLISGTNANDSMTGDFLSAALTTAGAVGGEDTFVFALNNGNDTITDFRSTDSDSDATNGVGDKVDLMATGLVWTDLDTTGEGTLDASDASVSTDGSGNLVLDLGLALGGAAGVDTITFLGGVTSFVESDFLFSAGV